MIPTAYQDRLLRVPSSLNLFLGGGRGSGKSFAGLLLALRHAEEAGSGAKILFLRETLPGIRELEDDLEMLLRSAYGSALRSNRQEHVWRLPNGAQISASYLDAPSDYNQFQGKSFSMIVVEECGQFRSMKLLDLMRSSLRLSPGRLILIGNPGGRNHSVLHSRYVAGRMPWLPFEDPFGDRWVSAPATFRENPHLPANYEQKLFAATGNDKALFAAWAQGDWHVLRGAFLADVIDPGKQMFRDPGFDPRAARGAHGFISCDWGISSPSVGHGCVFAMAPLGRFPRGSLLLLDEVSSADPDDLSAGQGWSPGRLGDALKEMALTNGLPLSGCIDDSRGLGESLIEVMRKPPIGIYFVKPIKGRLDGAAKLRELLYNSQQANGRPGMFISERCTNWWQTVPEIPRDPLRPNDVDSKAIDHAYDSSRYAATFEPRVLGHRYSTGY